MGSWRPSVIWLAALLAFDLGTKGLANAFSRVSFIEPTSNPELMLGLGDLSVPPLLFVSTAVVAVGVFGASRLVGSGLLHPVAVPLGIAGFLGNVIDRVLLGHVRDWLVLGPTVWNLADFFLAAAIAMTVTAGIRSVLTDTASTFQHHDERGKKI